MASTGTTPNPDELQRLINQKLSTADLEKREGELKFKRMSKNRDLLEMWITRHEYPNPVLILIGIFVVMITIYLLYMLLLRPKIAGTWVTTNPYMPTDTWVIEQKMLSNQVDVHIYPESQDDNSQMTHPIMLRGQLDGKLLSFYGINGSWVDEDRIELYSRGELVDVLRKMR